MSLHPRSVVMTVARRLTPRARRRVPFRPLGRWSTLTIGAGTRSAPGTRAPGTSHPENRRKLGYPPAPGWRGLGFRTRVVSTWKVRVGVFNLPEVAPFALGRAPLAQALAQVRFPIQARLASLEGVAAIQDGLRERYPFMEPEQVATFQLQLGPLASQAAVNQGSQRFVFRGEEDFSVTIAPDMVNLTAGADYAGADDFKERFREVLDVLQQSIPMVRCDRVAARYLNIATVPPGDDLAWSRWFRPDVAGWPGAGIAADGGHIQSSLSQVQMTAPPRDDLAIFPGEVTGLVRTGLVPGGSAIEGVPPVQVDVPSFVIDLDLFTAHAQTWNGEHLSQQFAILHNQIERFFRWTLSQEGEQAFELTEVGA